MVNGLGALFVAETGVVDYREVTRFLAGSVRSAGGELRTGVEVTGIAETGDAVRLETSQGPVWTRHAVFCGGLQADRLAALAGLELDLRIVPFRGEYFDVAAAKRGLVSHLIYPIPDPALPFLGVHLTTTVTGELNVGPNAVLGLAREKYAKVLVRPPGRGRHRALPGHAGGRPPALADRPTGDAQLGLEARVPARVPEVLPLAPGGRPSPQGSGDPRPGGDAGRHVGARLPAAEHSSHPARAERAVAGGDLRIAHRPDAGAGGAGSAMTQPLHVQRTPPSAQWFSTAGRRCGAMEQTDRQMFVRSPFPPIGDYAFLSDCQTSALIAPSGNVEWMCLPRMDSPSVFAAMLDRDARRVPAGTGRRYGARGAALPARHDDPRDQLGDADGLDHRP